MRLELFSAINRSWMRSRDRALASLPADQRDIFAVVNTARMTPSATIAQRKRVFEKFNSEVIAAKPRVGDRDIVAQAVSGLEGNEHCRCRNERFFCS